MRANFESGGSFEARKKAYRERWYGADVASWKLNPQFAKAAPLKVNYALIEAIPFEEIKTAI
jgi:hypothetical protein